MRSVPFEPKNQKVSWSAALSIAPGVLYPGMSWPDPRSGVGEGFGVEVGPGTVVGVEVGLGATVGPMGGVVIGITFDTGATVGVFVGRATVGVAVAGCSCCGASHWDGAVITKSSWYAPWDFLLLDPISMR